MPPHSWPRGLRSPIVLAATLGLLATGAVLGTLSDPGITSDEPLDVRVGRHYLAQADRWIGLYTDAVTLAGPRRADADRLFRDNAQHPPLGRVAVGLASLLFEPIEGILGGADPFSVHPARVAPAVGFGLLVGLLASTAARRFGLAAGVATGLAMLGMPRLFAHAHFATLDTLLALGWIAAWLAVERAVSRPRPVLALALAGVVWGLALLVKIHAWVLVPVVVVLVVLRLSWKPAALGLAAWAATGLAVFFVGWPWLWFDPLHRLQAFLGTSVVRLPLKVQYFGQVYLDHDVPWHYPWVYFLVTVPVGLHLLGVAGAYDAWRSRRADPLPLLAVGTVGLWLVLFSTNAPVYDGERLFLVVFPVWALLIGRGTGRLWAALKPRFRLGLVLVFLGQGYGLVTLHPFGLSYYNALIGGLRGAERLGLELTYWGDAIDARVLETLARRASHGDLAAVAPTLHHVQAAAYMTGALQARGIQLADESQISAAQWLVVYRRTAYWPARLESQLARCHPILIQRRQGVWLSGIWLRPGVRFADRPFRNPQSNVPIARNSSPVSVESFRSTITIRSE